MTKTEKSIRVCLNPNINAVLKEMLVQHLKEHRISTIKPEEVIFPYRKPCPIKDTKLEE